MSYFRTQAGNFAYDSVTDLTTTNPKAPHGTPALIVQPASTTTYLYAYNGYLEQWCLISASTTSEATLTNNGGGSYTFDNGVDPPVTFTTTVGVVSGSGVNGQVTYWIGATIIAGDANFLWDFTNKVFSVGDLTGSGNGTSLVFDDSAITFQTITGAMTFFSEGTNQTAYMGSGPSLPTGARCRFEVDYPNGTLIGRLYGAPFLHLDYVNQIYKLGDVAPAANGSLLTINDAFNKINLNTALMEYAADGITEACYIGTNDTLPGQECRWLVQYPQLTLSGLINGAHYLKLDANNNLYSFGDLSFVTGGSQILIDNANGIIDIAAGPSGISPQVMQLDSGPAGISYFGGTATVQTDSVANAVTFGTSGFARTRVNDAFTELIPDDANSLTHQMRWYELFANGTEYFSYEAPADVIDIQNCIFPDSGPPGAGYTLAVQSVSLPTIQLSWQIAGGSPGGADTNVQYNDGGFFGGDSNFIWNKTNRVFEVGDIGGTHNQSIFYLDDTNKLALIRIDPAGNNQEILFSSASNITSLISSGVSLQVKGIDNSITFLPNGLDRVEIFDTFTRFQPYGTSAGNTYSIKFLELLANGTDSIAWAGPDARTSNTSLILVLPPDDPTSGQTISFGAPVGGVSIGAWITSGGGGSPGGSDTYIQYNDGGVFGGDVNFTWDKNNTRLQTFDISGKPWFDLDPPAFSVKLGDVGTTVDGTQLAILPGNVSSFGTSTVFVQIDPANGVTIGPTLDVTNSFSASSGAFAMEAPISLQPGFASAGLAPIYFASGTNLTVPEDGAMEYNGTHLFFTIGSTRFQIDQQSATGANTALSNLASVSINTSLLAQTGVDLGSTTKPFRNAFLFGSGTYGTTYIELTGTPTSGQVATFPDNTGTVAELNLAQSWTAAQTFSTNIFRTTGIQDINGATSLLISATASAVDGFRIINAATANPATVQFLANGTDTNINAEFQPKGTGRAIITDGNDTSKKVAFDNSGGTSATKTTLAFTQSTNRTITFPDVTGTILTTGIAVTVAQGGTGLTAGTSGGIPYFSATNTMASSALLTASAIILGGGAGTTPVSLALGTANQVLGMNNAATAHEYKTITVSNSGTTYSITNAANSIQINIPTVNGSTNGGVWSTGADTVAGDKTFSGGTIAITKTAGSALSVGTSTFAFRTINAGSNIAAQTIFDVDNSGTTAGSKSFVFETANHFVFLQANGMRRIARAAIKQVSAVDTAASETGELAFYTKPAGGVMVEAGRFSTAQDFQLISTITKYNNISTVSNGVSSVYATVNLTAQVAAITATTAYAVPASGVGQYRISFVAKVTTAATTSSVLGGTAGFQIKYTDADDSVVVTTGALSNISGSVLNTNTTQNTYAGTIMVNVKASSNIQYLMDYTSVGLTAMQYNLHIIIERV